MIQISAIVINDSNDSSILLDKFAKENAILIKVIGHAISTKEGIDLIKLKRPDVVFLDTTINDDSFLEALDQLDFNSPKLVFISEDEYDAVKAFKYNAIDFILKPIDFNNVILSLYKVVKRINMEHSYQNEKINNINALNAGKHTNEYVAIASLDKIELIKMSEIIFCKADGRYTIFHLLDGKKIMSSRNLGDYNDVLDPTYFFRIHHSYVINIRQITTISKKDGYFCEFPDGSVLPVAKRRQEDFNKFIRLKE
ncbi:LytTR family DNA-binding domain-containing protein [Flavobacterium sp. PL12]|uniref:LytR/AlgR family response regulator transcription factor n=1 Tax=Flavobacterium sp. PL12 TaxID=3071718 RepID=UPI00319D9D2B